MNSPDPVVGDFSPLVGPFAYARAKLAVERCWLEGIVFFAKLVEVASAIGPLHLLESGLMLLLQRVELL